MNRPLKTALVVAGLSLTPLVHAVQTSEILENYADIAHAKLEDSLSTAQALQMSVSALLASPGEQTLAAAKRAWLDARVPYQQSEVYRFGNPFMDEWEGKVNAWPLDEGLIDYVDGSYGTSSDENVYFTANVIANSALEFGRKAIDAAKISPELIRELHEVDEVEANVATGYHAVEFLLWGQDLNGTQAGAGARPWSDFSLGGCTGGSCERRRAYLEAATSLLLSDLEEAVAAWAPGGEARETLMSRGGLSAIVTGMGNLSYGELAGERMKLGLMLHDPEEEHDCFSDNTHNAHYFNALGIRNVYLGTYERIDGRVVQGVALSDLVKSTEPELDAELRARLGATIAAMMKLKETADSGAMAYDQMIGEGNEGGNAIVQAAIDALVDQTRSIEKVVAALSLESVEFEGSDSLDEPKAVFQ